MIEPFGSASARDMWEDDFNGRTSKESCGCLTAKQYPNNTQYKHKRTMGRKTDRLLNRKRTSNRS